MALEILTVAGFQCDVARNGREAIDQVLLTRYDAVLMDCQMPEMDGLAAARELRRLESDGALRQRGYRLPIIALTANATSGDRELCLASGMDDYLTKPLDAVKLIELLDAMVDNLDGIYADEGPANVVVSSDMSGMPLIETSATANREPAIDMAALCAAAWAIASWLVGLSITSWTSCRSRLEIWKKRFGANQLRDAASQAHALKGMAANLSAQRLQQVVDDLEMTCASGDRLLAVTDIARVRREVQRCLEFVAAEGSPAPLRRP